MHSCTTTQRWNSTASHGQDFLLCTSHKRHFNTRQPWISPITRKVKLFSLLGTPTPATPFCYTPTTSVHPPESASLPLPHSIPYYFSTQGIGLVLLPSPLLPAALFSLAATGLVLIEAGPLRKACMAVPGCTGPWRAVPSCTRPRQPQTPSGPAGPSRQPARARGRGRFRPPIANHSVRRRWRHATRAAAPEGAGLRGQRAQRARGGRGLRAGAAWGRARARPLRNAASRTWCKEQKDAPKRASAAPQQAEAGPLCAVGPATVPRRGLLPSPAGWGGPGEVKWGPGEPGPVLGAAFAPLWASVRTRSGPRSPRCAASGCWCWSETNVTPLCSPIISNDIHHS